MEIPHWSHLANNALLLNSVNTPDSNAVVRFEIMSGALIWSDEHPEPCPWEVTNGLRWFFACRTAVILGKPVNERMGELVRRCHEHFPNWIGLLPERFEPTPALLAEYRRGDVTLRWCLRNEERGTCD